MWQRVRIELEMSTSVGWFSVDLGSQSCLLPVDQNIQEKNHSARHCFHCELDGKP
jgi:hypothetical protein